MEKMTIADRQTSFRNPNFKGQNHKPQFKIKKMEQTGQDQQGQHKIQGSVNKFQVTSEKSYFTIYYHTVSHSYTIIPHFHSIITSAVIYSINTFITSSIIHGQILFVDTITKTHCTTLELWSNIASV